MQMTRLKTSLLALGAALCVALPTQAQELSAREHKDLGKLIQSYLEEDSADDKAEIKEKLQKALEKIGKKRVEKGGDTLQGALALTDDLGAALTLATSLKSKRGGNSYDGEVEFRGNEINYKVWVPKPYKHTKPSPLIICLPGLGSEGTPMNPDQFLSEQWITSEARDGALMAAVAMPDDVDTWQEASIANVLLTLRDLRETYAIDPDRVYLLGRGPGVATAVSLGSKFPHIFAGVAGQAGDAGETSWGNFRNLPTFFHGGGSQASAFNDGVGEEFKNCTLQPEATEDDIWAWMKENPRVANPTKVTLVPGNPIPNKAYWVEIAALDSDGEVTLTAEADREANKVVVTSVGVPSVTLYFNDKLLDLDKPITLVLNGEEQTVYVRRNIDDLLALYTRGTSDAGKLYVAKGVYDLP